MIKKMEYTKHQCTKCKYRNKDNTCNAFPKGIPSILFFGLADHDIVLEGQEGNYVYEINVLLAGKKKEEREIRNKKQIPYLYKENKKKLPLLILEKISKLGYDTENIDKVKFEAKLTRADEYLAKIRIECQDVNIKLSKDALSPDFELFKAFKIINLIEKIVDKKREWVHLEVFNDETYNYLQEFFG